jgi:hypothetical protein
MNDTDLQSLHTLKRWPALLKEFDKEKNVIARKFSKIKRRDPQTLIPFSKNKLWGYLDKNTREVVVSPEFAELGFMSDCTYARYKDETALKISARGEVLEIIPRQRRRTDMEIAVEADDHVGPKAVSGANGFKGFTLDKKNRITTFSDIYEYDCRVCDKIWGPYMINGKWYATVSKEKHWGLIDMEGNVHPIIDFQFKDLYYVADPHWFYYEKHDGERGFMNEKGEVKLKNELINSFYPLSIKTLHLVGQSDGKQSGVINMETMEWELRPQRLPVVQIAVTTKGECIRYQHRMERNQIADVYFLVRDDSYLVYMDKTGNVFKPVSD